MISLNSLSIGKVTADLEGLNKVRGYARVRYNDRVNYLPGFKGIQKKKNVKHSQFNVLYIINKSTSQSILQ